jgi:hypothetical protein
MTRHTEKLARVAVACGMVGFPLWLLSYSWVPFATAGREMGSLSYLPLVGEVGALLAGIATVGLGRIARQHSQTGTTEHRLASRGLAIGVLLLVLIVVPNIVGGLWLAR